LLDSDAGSPAMLAPQRCWFLSDAGSFCINIASHRTARYYPVNVKTSWFG